MGDPAPRFAKDFVLVQQEDIALVQEGVALISDPVQQEGFAVLVAKLLYRPLPGLRWLRQGIGTRRFKVLLQGLFLGSGPNHIFFSIK